VNRLEELQGDEESSGNVPTLLFIEEGEYRADTLRSSAAEYLEKYVRVTKPLSMYGAGRGMTTLVGVGLKIEGKKSDGIVEIEDLTIKGGELGGLFASWGMKLILRGVSVVECEYGVVAQGLAQGGGVDITCNDLQVVGCGESGVLAYNNATITLSGQGTCIQRNGTKGKSESYGMKANSSSKIKLVAPLNKEQISTNNSGGGNWDGYGTIVQVDSDGNVL